MNEIISQYLDNTLSIEDAILAFDKSNYSPAEIKAGGIVYTPKYIADFIVQKINPQLTQSICEPSVGHGIFLFSLLEFIKNKFGKEKIKDYFIEKVWAFDIQEKNILELRELLHTWFKKHDVQISQQEIAQKILVDNTLNQQQHWDIIFGNPPYIRIQNVEYKMREEIRQKFLSCEKGNIDLYYAFIEWAIEHADKTSFIVPNSYIKNTSAKTLREIMSKTLTECYDFSNFKLFNGVGTYTSIFLCDSNSNNDEIHYKRAITRPDTIEKLREMTTTDTLRADDFIDTLTHKGEGFDIHTIYSPIATLRDKIFILNDEQNHKITHHTVPLLKCTKLKCREDIIQNKTRIITPYNTQGDIFEEKDIDSSVMHYLKEHRDELALRDKGKQDKYERWYCYGRKQGLNSKIPDNTTDEGFRLIIIPGMFSQKHTFFDFHYDDIGENFYLTSGFILKINTQQAQDVLDFLNSHTFIQLCEKFGSIKPGGGNLKYYSLSKKIIEKILK